MRIVIAEDGALFREGLIRLLSEAGHDVVAAVGDADALIESVADKLPDLAVIDVRMPPTLTDDGARAAQKLRARHPTLPMLLLSQHIETRYSVELVASGGFGYLLKDRVLDVKDFIDQSNASQREAQHSTQKSSAGSSPPPGPTTRSPTSRAANERCSHS